MKRTVILIVSAVIIIAGTGFYVLFGNTETSSNFYAMDTNVTIKLTGRKSDETVEKIKSEILSLDSNVLSRNKKSSAVYKLNSDHGGELSSQLLSYINTLTEVSVKSAGRFDFTLGALSDLWNFKSENPKVPDDEDIKAILAEAGYDKISIDGSKISFTEGVELDFGASGKGIALDEIKNILKDTDTKEAVISVGGSILFYGDREFTVGIASPEGSNNIAELKLPACCVSTSGNYERYFEIDGVRYHHILDPETGYPADSGLKSVTIVSQSGILSDALSTACFVLGIDEGKKLAEEFDCEAVFVTDDNRIITTGSLGKAITVKDDSYRVSKE